MQPSASEKDGFQDFLCYSGGPYRRWSCCMLADPLEHGNHFQPMVLNDYTAFTLEHLTRTVWYETSRDKPMPQSTIHLNSPVNPVSPSQATDEKTTSGPLPQQPDNASGAATLATPPFNRKPPAADRLDRSTSSKNARATPPPPHPTQTKAPLRKPSPPFNRQPTTLSTNL